MKINKEIQVELEGKTYNCKGTFELIERIEQRVNVMAFHNSLSLGSPKITDVAWVIYSALNLAGCQKNRIEVGESVLQDFTNYMMVAANLIKSCFPDNETNEIEEDKKKS